MINEQYGLKLKADEELYWCVMFRVRISTRSKHTEIHSESTPTGLKINCPGFQPGVRDAT